MFGLRATHGAALEPGGQKVSISPLPRPPPPVSYVHFAASGAASCGPLNSSFQTKVQVVWPTAVVPTTLLAHPGNVAKNRENARVFRIVGPGTTASRDWLKGPWISDVIDISPYCRTIDVLQSSVPSKSSDGIGRKRYLDRAFPLFDPDCPRGHPGVG